MSSILPHVIVPVRSLSDGKRRLGLAVDAEERATLVVGLLRSTIAACASLAGVTVVSADRTALAVARQLGAAAVEDRMRDDLNAALRQGRAMAVAAGAQSVLFLPADLPLLSAAALERVLQAADAALAAGANGPVVVVAPSEVFGGTNALLLSPPDIIDPAFGPASLAAHLEAAATAGASVQLVADPELGFDLDTPDDLERLEPRRLVELLEQGALTLEELAATPAA